MIQVTHARGEYYTVKKFHKDKYRLVGYFSYDVDGPEQIWLEDRDAVKKLDAARKGWQTRLNGVGQRFELSSGNVLYILLKQGCDRRPEEVEAALWVE